MIAVFSEDTEGYITLPFDHPSGYGKIVGPLTYTLSGSSVGTIIQFARALFPRVPGFYTLLVLRSGVSEERSVQAAYDVVVYSG